MTSLDVHRVVQRADHVLHGFKGSEARQDVDAIGQDVPTIARIEDQVCLVVQPHPTACRVRGLLAHAMATITMTTMPMKCQDRKTGTGPREPRETMLAILLM